VNKIIRVMKTYTVLNDSRLSISYRHENHILLESFVKIIVTVYTDEIKLHALYVFLTNVRIYLCLYK